MTIFAANYPMDLGSDTVEVKCWDPLDPLSTDESPITPLEVSLLKPLPVVTLDAYRRLFLQAVVSPSEPQRAARAVVQLAFEDELRVFMTEALVPAHVLEAKVCTRQRYLDIDNSMLSNAYLARPVIAALVSAGVMTPPYAHAIDVHLTGRHPRARVCAAAVLLCLAARKLNP